MARLILLIVLCVPGGALSSEAASTSQGYVASDLGLAIVGGAAHREYVARAFALSARAGYRWGSWGGYLQLESASWFAADGSRDDELTGVVNLQLGGEFLYADDFVRTALAIGPSMLVTGTELDTLGQVGFAFELRPAGLRWTPVDRWVIGLDPLVLSLTAPALDGIPLIELEYRTTVYGEYLF